MVIGVGSQLRRVSDGARFDVIAVSYATHWTRSDRWKLRNLQTGRHHWILSENYAKRYEPCPAL